ncbi:MAG: glycosyltransferase [Acidobacteriota bacterium]|nr:glycosyltransferase [Acidobacteriota bacterium]
MPGYKSGGGMRSIVNMVARFKNQIDFRVITFDHDGDGKPYTTVKINDWNEIEGTQVYYLSKDKIKISKLRKLIEEVKPDSIYLNSVFSVMSIFVLTLRKLKLIRRMGIMLAPEGELSEGALKLKATKKKAFTKIAKSSGLYRDLIWKTTAEAEKKEAESFKGRGGKIFIAPNLPARDFLEGYDQGLKPKKNVGEANMIFLSRFMRKKNFKWLVDNLKDIEGKLKIDIIGPLEDEVYWKETQKSINNLPSNIKVEYKGHIENEMVVQKMSEYHFFVLPTLGENFGHVFIEALAAGCPLLISDRTPWLNLEEKGIGWDIPLEKPKKWREKINYCIDLDEVNYRETSMKSREFARRWVENPIIVENTLTVLKNSLKNGLSRTI